MYRMTISRFGRSKKPVEETDLLREWSCVKSFISSDAQGRPVLMAITRLATGKTMRSIQVGWFIVPRDSDLISRRVSWFSEGKRAALWKPHIRNRRSVGHGGSSEKQSGRNTLTIGRFMRDHKIALVSFVAIDTKRRSRTYVPLFHNKTFQYRLQREETSRDFLINIWWIRTFL